MTAALELEPDLELIQAIDQVGEEALKHIEAEYGYSHLPSLARNPMAKHNGWHGEFVGDNTDLLLGHLGQSPLIRAIGRTAGRAHDYEVLLGIGANEMTSADWVAEKLRRAGLPETKVQIGRVAVIGSEPIIEDGVLVGQKASHMDFTSKEEELVAKGLASADVGAEIYAPESPFLSRQLYRERNGCRPGEDPPMDGLLDFQGGQIQMLENYPWPLPKARQLFAANYFDVIAYAHQVYKQLERGEFDTFRQLLSQDMAFMNAVAVTSYPFRPSRG